MIRMNYDTWQYLNTRISELFSENIIESIESLIENDDIINNLTKQEVGFFNVGNFLGYRQCLEDLGLLVEAEHTHSLYINPKCVEPME